MPSLTEVRSNSRLMKELYDHARKEYSAENVKFLFATKYLLQQLRSDETGPVVDGQAKKNFLGFYKKYIQDRGGAVDAVAMSNVNLSGAVRGPLDEFATILEQDTAAVVFTDDVCKAIAAAETAIWRMFENDTLARYAKTPEAAVTLAR